MINFNNNKIIKYKSITRFSVGFTIIELIVITVVIGIIASISVVSYNGIKSKANDTSVLSDIENMNVLQKKYSLSNGLPGKAYFSGNGPDAELGFKPSGENMIEVTINGNDYCIKGYNTAGTKNSIINAFEKGSSNTACSPVVPSIVVVGGAPSIDGNYTIRKFTASGTLSISGGTLTGVNVLVVGGGARGSRGNVDSGGNGGNGGQVLTLTNQNLTGDISVAVGVSSQNSSFGSNIATTGTGASGGVGVIYGTGSAGSNGIISNITGSPVYYGGGGGAGAFNGTGLNGGLGGGGKGGNSTEDGGSHGYCYNGTPGQVNTGGGGGGSGAEGVNWCSDIDGGSGVVIVRYLTNQV